MDENALILLFWGGVLLGVIVGSLVGWRFEMMAGAGVGALVIGLGGIAAAIGFASRTLDFIEHSERTRGRIVESSRGFAIEFALPDGSLQRFAPLRGSTPDLDADGTMPVRYLRADPKQAVLEDVQNLWGGTLAFTLFGLLPFVFGLFFVGQAWYEARPRVATSAPLSPQRRRIGRNLTIAANLIMLIGIGSGWLIDDERVAHDFGRTFLAIAAGVAVHGIGFIVRRSGGWSGPGVCFVIAFGFALFGAGTLLLD